MLKNCPGGLEKYRGTFPDNFRKSRKKWSGTPLEPRGNTFRWSPDLPGTFLEHVRKSPKKSEKSRKMCEKVTSTSCLLHCCNRRRCLLLKQKKSPVATGDIFSCCRRSVFCCNRRSVLLHRARICFSMNYFLEKDARRNSLSAGVLNNSGRIL